MDHYSKNNFITTIDNYLGSYLQWSAIYRWSMSRIKHKLGVAKKTYYQHIEDRLENLRKDPFFLEKLEGWWFPDYLDFDSMFFSSELPMIFSDALDITDHVIGTFSIHDEQQGHKLLIVAADGCSVTPNSTKRRNMLERGCYRRIEKIADDHSIPILDLYETFSARGDPKNAHWLHDGHWNQTGHLWAAESIYEYLVDDKNGLFDE